MAKQQYKIRWRDSDTAELQRAINNFNAKLYRLKKNNPEIADYLPERLKKSDVIKSIGTRADFNRVINSYKRFSKRGAEAPVHSSRGLKTTQWKVDELRHMERIDNARKTRERKKLEKVELKVAGKGQKQSAVTGMGSTLKNSLKPTRSNIDNLSRKDFEMRFKALEGRIGSGKSEQRLTTMRENYIKGLRLQGFLGDMPELEETIRSLDLNTFYETAMSDATATFLHYKDPIAYEARKENIKKAWETALRNSKG